MRDTLGVFALTDGDTRDTWRSSSSSSSSRPYSTSADIIRSNAQPPKQKANNLPSAPSLKRQAVTAAAWAGEAPVVTLARRSELAGDAGGAHRLFPRDVVIEIRERIIGRGLCRARLSLRRLLHCRRRRSRSRRRGQDRRGRGRRDGRRRAAQPGTLSRSTQPTISITGPKNDFLTALIGTETRSAKRTTGASPPRPAARTWPRPIRWSTASRKIAAFVSSLSSPNVGFHTQHRAPAYTPRRSGQGGGGLPTGDSFMS